MSIFEIVKKRGIIGNLEDSENLENMNTDSERTKKVKFKDFVMNKIYKNEDEDNIVIKKDKEGVKFIAFSFKNDFKKIYKKEKWILKPIKAISFTLKDEKQGKSDKKDSKKKNSKVNVKLNEEKSNNDKNINETNIKYKNKTEGQKLYKVKGDNQKTEKTYKYTGNVKKYVNNNEEEDDEEEEENESESSSNSSSNVNENKNENNDKNNQKNKELKFENSNKQLNYELLHNVNENYDKEKRNSHTNIFKGFQSDSDDNNEKMKKDFKRKNKRIYTIDVRKNNSNKKHPLDYFYFGDNKDKDFKRKERRGHTVDVRRMVGYHDFNKLEDNLKKVGKLKYKKARIKKFKLNKDDFEPYYTRRKKQNIFERLSAQNNHNFHFNNSNNKLNHDNFGKKDLNSDKTKNHRKKHYQNSRSSSNNSSDIEGSSDEKVRSNSAHKANKKLKILKTITPRANPNPLNKNKKSPCKKIKALKTKSFKNKKITININQTNKIKRKLQFKDKFKYNRRNNSISKTTQRHMNIDDISTTLNKSKFKETSGIDAIKSKFKKKLIEMDDKLLDAIHYYNGPIDISCISSKNYAQTVNQLSKKVLKNGFKCIKSKNNYFKFSNGVTSFFVEIVKIRNNILYYLIQKN